MADKKRIAALLLVAALAVPIPAYASPVSDMETKIELEKQELEKVKEEVKSASKRLAEAKAKVSHTEAEINKRNCKQARQYEKLEESVERHYGDSTEPLAIEREVSMDSAIKLIAAAGSVWEFNDAAEIESLKEAKNRHEEERKEAKEAVRAAKEEKERLSVCIAEDEAELGRLIEEAKPKFEGVELLYSARYGVTSSHLTKEGGVKWYGGHKETYYTQSQFPGGGLSIPGRHIADDGTIRDGDGYICVAADYSFLAKGSKLMTSLGPAKVYDTGCAYGTIDIYVNW